MNRLRHPKTAVRWRLTLLYGGLFLACGAALLAVTYALVSHDTVSVGPSEAWAGKALPGKPTEQRIRVPSRDAPPSIKRVLDTPAGQATLKLVGARQRIADLHHLEVESAIALAIMALISGGLGWLVAGRVLRPLERAYDAQRRFVANASHELRTPLTASRALLEMVITDPYATRETFRQTCRDALEENEQQEQLIDALLALAQGEQGVGHRELVDLAEVVRDALREHRADAERLDLDVELIRAAVSGDRRLLVRLVSNLLQNAIRHNVPDGYVRVQVGHRDGRPVLRIANSGPVVPAAEIDRLLAPFQRLAPDRLGHPSGFGLGLSIVAAVATAHDATIKITPGEAGGLRVEVGFPSAGVGRFAPEPPQLPEQAGIAQGEFVSQLR
ncbi:MAG TPA: HAMP domain-containing sensor histidine kinase [Solirubrobacteraceae bacterium]|nr:HAMP domain-containing sensor histidine kinase [Solirubrobacteraceae bacterium]